MSLYHVQRPVVEANQRKRLFLKNAIQNLLHKKNDLLKKRTELLKYLLHVDDARVELTHIRAFDPKHVKSPLLQRLMSDYLRGGNIGNEDTVSYAAEDTVVDAGIAAPAVLSNHLKWGPERKCSRCGESHSNLTWVVYQGKTDAMVLGSDPASQTLDLKMHDKDGGAIRYGVPRAHVRLSKKPTHLGYKLLYYYPETCEKCLKELNYQLRPYSAVPLASLSFYERP